ncbi:YqeG family HAD IIIA-type phosphatase [Bacillus tianshenii]|nr:YqeG family HAD IIIA-type phosphatase [Bacillus tianshenii]
MIKNFLPDQHVQSILDIKPEALKEKGVRGVITDLDNTLVEWDRPDATPELQEWFRSMQDHGILVMIISNNKEARVRKFAEPVGVPFIYAARKPMGRAFRRALKEMMLKKSDVVVIGDQLLTDVLGGNRAGFHTILVVPVAQSDGFITKFNRRVERRILSWMKRKGMIYWEE